jgi:hypothetical protein
MFYQISDVIQNYLKYDSVTRLEMTQKQFIPRIQLQTLPVAFKLSKLKNIYPEIIEVMKINDMVVRDIKFRRIISKYLIKLINELRFKEFLDITCGNDFIKTCKVLRNKQTFNCSDPRNTVSISNNLNNSYFHPAFEITFEDKTNCLHEHNVCFSQSLEKIELELELMGPTQVIVFYKSLLWDSETVFLNDNSKIEIFFTSYAHKKLNIRNQRCLEGNNNQNLKNYSSDNCFLDCSYRNLNQTYGCLPINSILELDFESHLASRGYRICYKKADYAKRNSVKGECRDTCLPECESVYYNIMVSTKEYRDRKVGTFVKIFPIKFPHFIYTETLYMDFNQLIYNCGGILGLWFGLSPLSLDNLRRILRSVRFKPIIFASIHFVLMIAFKSKQIIILFLKYLSRSLRSLYIQLKSIIKKLIDFIVYMFFELKRMITNLYLFLLMRLNNRIGISNEGMRILGPSCFFLTYFKIFQFS